MVCNFNLVKQFRDENIGFDQNVHHFALILLKLRVEALVDIGNNIIIFRISTEIRHHTVTLV